MGVRIPLVHPAVGFASPDERMLRSMDLPDFGIPEKLASRMSMAEQHDYLRAKFTRRGALRAGAVTAAVAGGRPRQPARPRPPTRPSRPYRSPPSAAASTAR